MPVRALLRVRALVVAALAMAVVPVLPGGAAPAHGFEVVYAPAGAAEAIHNGGVTAAWRQVPFVEVQSPHWPVARRLGKVSGTELSRMSAGQMAEVLRANWHRHPTGGQVGGRVAVDEIRPVDWDSERAGRLNQALQSLGADASRVLFYLAPALVEQVGRADPRQQLPDNLRTLVGAMQQGSIVYLELYRGTLEPYPLELMASHLTRWAARWPAERFSDLRVLFGPGGSVSQAEIWNRVRSTPAGRRILANGPGYYATTARGTAADGAAWAAQLRAFRANPDASPPGGDVAVPEGGGLVVPQPTAPVLPGARIVFTANRPGRAVVRLISSTGVVRVIQGSLVIGPSGRATIVLPRDIRPGAYRIRVSFQGAGLRDETTIPLRITHGPGSSSPARPGTPRARMAESQRLAAEAVRTLNAVQAWLDEGITTGDLAPHTFGGAFAASGAQGALAPSLRYGAGGAHHPAEPVAARPITPAPARRAGGAVRVTGVQLLINQRIASAAVARANAVDARLTAGLTGGDLKPGAITPGKLAPGVAIAALSDQAVPAKSAATPKPIPRGGARALRVTAAQIDINLRISRAALRRSQALAARLTAGLGEGDFRAGSIVRANLAPALQG